MNNIILVNRLTVSSRIRIETYKKSTLKKFLAFLQKKFFSTFRDYCRFEVK